MKNVTDFFFYILYVPDIVQYVQKGVYVTYTSQASKETASQYIIPVEGGCPEYAYCPQIMVIVGSGQRKTDEKVPPPPFIFMSLKEVVRHECIVSGLSMESSMSGQRLNKINTAIGTM